MDSLDGDDSVREVENEVQVEKVVEVEKVIKVCFLPATARHGTTSGGHADSPASLAVSRAGGEGRRTRG